MEEACNLGQWGGKEGNKTAKLGHGQVNVEFVAWTPDDRRKAKKAIGG